MPEIGSPIAVSSRIRWYLGAVSAAVMSPSDADHTIVVDQAGESPMLPSPRGFANTPGRPLESRPPTDTGSADDSAQIGLEIDDESDNASLSVAPLYVSWPPAMPGPHCDGLVPAASAAAAGGGGRGRRSMPSPDAGGSPVGSPGHAPAAPS